MIPVSIGMCYDAIDRRDSVISELLTAYREMEREVRALRDYADRLEHDLAWGRNVAMPDMQMERDMALSAYEAERAAHAETRGEGERLRECERAVERFAAMAQRFRQSAHECIIDGDAVSYSVAARLVDYARTIEATIEPDCCCGQRPDDCVCGCYEGEDGDE